MPVFNLAANLEFPLRHHHPSGLAVFELDVNRKNSNADFMLDADPAISILRQRHNAFARETIPRAHNWMARKWQFACRREDPQPARHFFFFRRQNKDRLRQIHLARDLLHSLVAESFGFGKDREGIATESSIGEYVELNEVVVGQSLNPPTK